MSHLGSRLDALADGELGHDERDRALAHVANCARCRSELDAARQVKARLTSLGAPDVPESLTGRLLALAAAPPPDGYLPTARRLPAPARPPAPEPDDPSMGGLPARRSAAAAIRPWTPASVSALGLALGAAVLAAAPVTPHVSGATASTQPAASASPAQPALVARPLPLSGAVPAVARRGGSLAVTQGWPAGAGAAAFSSIRPGSGWGR